MSSIFLYLINLGLVGGLLGGLGGGGKAPPPPAEAPQRRKRAVAAEARKTYNYLFHCTPQNISYFIWNSLSQLSI